MSSPFAIASKSRISFLKNKKCKTSPRLTEPDQNQALLVVKDRLSHRDAASLCDSIGKQTIGLIRAVSGARLASGTL